MASFYDNWAKENNVVKTERGNICEQCGVKFFYKPFETAFSKRLLHCCLLCSDSTICYDMYKARSPAETIDLGLKPNLRETALSLKRLEKRIKKNFSEIFIPYIISNDAFDPEASSFKTLVEQYNKVVNANKFQVDPIPFNYKKPMRMVYPEEIINFYNYHITPFNIGGVRFIHPTYDEMTYKDVWNLDISSKEFDKKDFSIFDWVPFVKPESFLDNDHTARLCININTSSPQYGSVALYECTTISTFYYLSSSFDLFMKENFKSWNRARKNKNTDNFLVYIYSHLPKNYYDSDSE